MIVTGAVGVTMIDPDGEGVAGIVGVLGGVKDGGGVPLAVGVGVGGG